MEDRQSRSLEKDYTLVYYRLFISEPRRSNQKGDELFSKLLKQKIRLIQMNIKPSGSFPQKIFFVAYRPQSCTLKNFLPHFEKSLEVLRSQFREIAMSSCFDLSIRFNGRNL